MLNYDVESGKYLNYNLSHDLCPKYVRHRGKAFKGGKAGSYIQGVIDLYDKEDHRITNYSGHLLASLSYKNNLDRSIQGPVETLNENVYLSVNSDGSYTVSYLVKKAGIWELSVVTDKFEHIQGSPFDVEITYGDVSPDRSFLTYLDQVGYVSNYRDFIVQSRDSYDNEVTEGGVEFVASVLGGGKIINLKDLNNGKDSNDLAGYDALNPWMSVFMRNSQLTGNLITLKDSLAKVLSAKQFDAETSYNAARLKVVHSIPALFTISEPDHAGHTLKRQGLIGDYRELNKQLNEIEDNIQEMIHSRDSLNDYIIDKMKHISQLYRTALQRFNRNTAQVLKLTRLAKHEQELRRRIYEADESSLAKLDRARKIETAIRALKDAQKVTEDEIVESEPEEIEERPGKLNETVPDKPNSLAFWLLEGRFRPPQQT
ncbi:uncharacterized protein TOT_030000770 [Theileria orientalis strain Shintoku]|uniref:Uncharacterized protein n=1 Tax=Theileria orientalis strain Shintoku TaxID=869250 RepID=J4C8W7_THEOR|nr:uncharacterized protein TOT_030000770 [Theileria orientalis strain Shintoku]BAM41508.1 uncharacterized protein TOT_030000770 [Theileria orientalis strain Shintoku]|eukprot:XP_009691809.1 uncharacterized protein TOT_030000770 [Theileria orientalis strain Shintoku]